MILMGIDSSTPQSSVALVKDGQVIEQAQVDPDNISNQVLVLIDKILVKSRTSLNDLDGFCLTVGPGSFTGLRIGASILKGLLLATSKPFVKIDTLESIALMAMPTNKKICTILDAKKKELYTAYFQSTTDIPERLSLDRALTPNQLCQEIKEPTVFIGNGLDSYGDFLASELKENFLSKPDNLLYTVAACTARIAEKRFESEKTNDLHSLRIKYVRKPEAELKLMEKESANRGGT
jgi:tRNA threonylcarbamoyladenosine biosynthesis protein TsaB